MCSLGTRSFLLAASFTGGVLSFRIARKKEATQKSDCYSKYDGRPLLRVSPCSAGEAEAVATSLKVGRCKLLEHEELAPPAAGGCGSALAICGQVEAAQLKQAHAQIVELVDADTGAYYRDMSGVPESFDAQAEMSGSLAQTDQTSGFYSKWRDLDSKQFRIDRMVNNSDGAAKIETFGESVQGRPLRLVRFTGKGYSPGMPRVVLTYQVHAREWIAGMAGVYAVEKLVEKTKANPQFLNGMELVLVPVSNPDGYVYSMTKDRMHRKNMRITKAMKAQMAAASLDQQDVKRDSPDFQEQGCDVGVDINRNAPKGWARAEKTEDQCVEVFGGEHPLSEPETQAISRLFKEAPMSVYIDIHSFSQFVLSSWSYTKEANPRKAEFDVLGKSIQAAIKSVHNMTYKYGTTPELLYIAEGVLPDYATSLGALGFTIELRPEGTGGFAPPPSEILPAAEECFSGVLAAIQHARSMPQPL